MDMCSKIFMTWSTLVKQSWFVFFHMHKKAFSWVSKMNFNKLQVFKFLNVFSFQKSNFYKYL